LFGGVIKLMWPAFTQKYVDVARWSKKLPTPGLDSQNFTKLSFGESFAQFCHSYVFFVAIQKFTYHSHSFDAYFRR
jgi:hypothetical protein